MNRRVVWLELREVGVEDTENGAENEVADRPGRAVKA